MGLLLCVNIYMVTEKLVLRTENSNANAQPFLDCSSRIKCTGAVFEQLQCLQSNTTSENKYAVTSLLVEINQDNSKYERWATVLGYSLRSTGKIPCSVDMILLTTYNMSIKKRKSLERFGWNIVTVEEIKAPTGVTAEVKYERFKHMFTKWHLFNMTKYEAVLYIDLDTLVVADIQDIFITYVADMIQKNVHLGWTHDIPEGESRMNAGVMLVRPSGAILHDMTHKTTILSYDKRMSEQGFMNEYFKPSQELVISQKYNYVPFVMNDTYSNKVENNPKIVHFVGVKPDVVAFLTRCWFRNSIHICNLLYDVNVITQSMMHV